MVTSQFFASLPLRRPRENDLQLLQIPWIIELYYPCIYYGPIQKHRWYIQHIHLYKSQHGMNHVQSVYICLIVYTCLCWRFMVIYPLGQ